MNDETLERLNLRCAAAAGVVHFFSKLYSCTVYLGIRACLLSEYFKFHSCFCIHVAVLFDLHPLRYALLKLVTVLYDSIRVKQVNEISKPS